MPLTTPLFTASQRIGEPSVIVLEDVSVGSDSDILVRHIFLQKDDGTYLVPAGTTTDYIVWDYDESTIDVDILDKDLALNITVQWAGVSSALYSKTLMYVFTLYNEEFDYQLVSLQAAQNKFVPNVNYYMNRIKLRVSINDAMNAVSKATSITNAQMACDRGTYLRENETLFF